MFGIALAFKKSILIFNNIFNKCLLIKCLANLNSYRITCQKIFLSNTGELLVKVLHVYIEMTKKKFYGGAI